MSGLLRQLPTTLTPEVDVDDALRLLAKLLSGRVVKEIRFLAADETFTFEPGFLYSVAAVKEGALLNLVDETTTGIYEGVAVEFLSSDVFASVTASGSGGQVQIVIY